MIDPADVSVGWFAYTARLSGTSIKCERYVIVEKYTHECKPPHEREAGTPSMRRKSELFVVPASVPATRSTVALIALNDGPDEMYFCIGEAIENAIESGRSDCESSIKAMDEIGGRVSGMDIPWPIPDGLLSYGG